MADPFAALRSVPRPGDAITAWVETEPAAIHFLDAVFSSGSGEANVRREYRDVGGRRLFKVFVAPGCEAEVRRTLSRVARYVRIGEVRVES